MIQLEGYVDNPIKSTVSETGEETDYFNSKC